MTLSEELQDAKYASMTDQEATDSLNDPIIKTLKECQLTALGIMDELGATEGAAVLDALETQSASNSSVKWAMKSISTTGINVGNLTVRGMLDAFVSASVISQESADTLKAKAEETVSRAKEISLPEVQVGQVTRARNPQ